MERFVCVHGHFYQAPRVRVIASGLLKQTVPEVRRKASKGDAFAGEWVRHFESLGEKLNFARRQLRAE